MTSLFARNLAEHRVVLDHLEALGAEVELAGATVAQAMAEGGKLLIFGNGGSAADSQHLASELTGRFIRDRRPLAAIALTTDSSALTSIANDYSYDEVFARLVRALGRPGDVLLAISTSGNSINVLQAVNAARDLGIVTVGLLGHDGGRVRERCDIAVVVPSSTTARIQEAHILIGHTICGLVEAKLGLA